MKTNLSFPKRLIFAMLTIFAGTSLLTACPGNKGGGGEVVPVSTVVFPACAGCSGISATQLVASIPSDSRNTYRPLTMSWQLLGDANALNMSQQYYPGTTLYSNYQGQVIARGGMTFPSQLSDLAGRCIVPAGQYTFDTTVVGQMSGGRFRVLDIAAIGPTTFRFQTDARIYRDPMNGAERVHGTIVVLAVNGIPCGGLQIEVF